jgi:hypothetical protein
MVYTTKEGIAVRLVASYLPMALYKQLRLLLLTEGRSYAAFVRQVAEDYVAAEAGREAKDLSWMSWKRRIREPRPPESKPSGYQQCFAVILGGNPFTFNDGMAARGAMDEAIASIVPMQRSNGDIAPKTIERRRMAKALRLRYGLDYAQLDGQLMPFEDIAHRIGKLKDPYSAMSRERARQVVMRALELMRIRSRSDQLRQYIL